MAEKMIVVAGDTAVDWFTFPVGAADSGSNWRLQPAMHQAPMCGGVALLGAFTDAAVHAAGVSAKVLWPRLPEPIAAICPSDVVHSNAVLEACRSDGNPKATVLRVRRSLGFMGPEGALPSAQRVAPDPEEADVVVLDDVGNGFREQRDAWPLALTSGRASVIVYKMSRPLTDGSLWRCVTELPRGQRVVVIRADDLRKMEEIHISRALSWERTAKDLVYQIQRSDRLQSLQACPFVVVLLDTDGAILYRGGEDARATLFFDSSALEGGHAASIDGSVFGLASLFTATLAAEIATQGIGAIERAIPLGLARARVLLAGGYTRENGVIAHQLTKVFAAETTGAAYASCPVPPPSNLNDSDPGFWRVLDQRTRNTRHVIARNIILRGAKSTLQGIPVGTFGVLKTIDRAEIESYGAIRELIIEFLGNPKPARPLCFAVFGPPGAGKSFGVKQVLKSLGRDEVAVLPAFNVSQLREYQDLVAAFHIVRDTALGGKIPVAFFDEFDADALAWIKYFLAPMQDGEFRDGEAVHPTGKAIFVFAGGTRSSLENFQLNKADDDPHGEHLVQAGDATACADDAPRLFAFRDAKGPDFVSRLRGFVNVMGPNRQSDNDDAFIIRRAMMLRVMLEQSPKTTQCFDSRGGLRIDAGVLRAMLNVSTYKHGTRSIEALLDMSRLTGKRRYELSALPREDQLDQHVDAAEFMFLTARERFQSLLAPRELPQVDEATIPRARRYRCREDAIVEPAARLIHEDFQRQRELEGKSVDPYEAQSEAFQLSNKDAAEDIPRKLLEVGHGVRKILAGKEALTPDLTDEEVMRLARLEHERWCAERRIQGFAHGAKVPGRKLSPYLVSFDNLPPDIQQYDVQAARALPAILKQLGYEIYRMQAVEEIDEGVIDTLARAIHADYVAQRIKDGQTPDTNSALVDYDKLSPHLKASNCDSASTIPRKLRAVGYEIRRPPMGRREPAMLELSKEEIEKIAEIEHVRWNWHHWLNGWSYKPGAKKKDEANKTHPCLVPWGQLPREIQDYDRQSARLIPKLLKDAGYEAYRLLAVTQ